MLTNRHTRSSVHTASLAGILEQLGISLLVTTYQAGKLIVVRSEGGRVNTHFRGFPTPMRLTLKGDRLALGTRFHSGAGAARDAVSRGCYGR